MSSIVIVGGGQTAAAIIHDLHELDYQRDITLISEESYLPYERPPLSKKYLAGELTEESLLCHSAQKYQEMGVNFLLDSRVDSLDRNNKRLTLNDNQQMGYSKLVFATGSRVRRLSIPGHDLKGICYLRTIEDAHYLQRVFRRGKRLLICGAGYVGLEVAAIAVTMGMNVTVLEMENRILNRVAGPELAEFYSNKHKQSGVEIINNIKITAFSGTEYVDGVICNNGQKYSANMVLVGVGVLPNQELAEQAGILVDNGILVDEYCCTNDPNIFAAGDCTNHYNFIYRRRLRLESVQNALGQAKVVASELSFAEPLFTESSILEDRIRTSYNELPWFWSEQYDLRLQTAGLSQGYETTVIRGDIASQSFTLFYLLNDRIIATDSVNDSKVFMLSKSLISEGVQVDAEQLIDREINFKKLSKILLSQ